MDLLDGQQAEVFQVGSLITIHQNPLPTLCVSLHGDLEATIPSGNVVGVTRHSIPVPNHR